MFVWGCVYVGCLRLWWVFGFNIDFCVRVWFLGLGKFVLIFGFCCLGVAYYLPNQLLLDD